MKQIIFFKKTWAHILFIFILSTKLPAQTPGLNAFFVSPGNNSCNAGGITAACIAGPFFEFSPTGLTLGELNHLATDYKNPETLPWANFRFWVYIQAPCGLLPLIFEFGFQTTPNPAWISSGNVTSPGSAVFFWDCEENPVSLSYSAVQALYGSYPVSSIVLEAGMCNFSYPPTIVYLDNTVINNMTYTYDDCDADGLLDIYDCDPAHGGNNKALICHEGQTICVAMAALQAHLNHGDYMGSCVAARSGNIVPPEEVSIKEIKLYPNPANNQITIQNNNNKPLGTVSIYDVSGKMIYKNVFGSSQAIIDVKGFSSGVYYLRSDQIETAIKFVKQ